MYRDLFTIVIYKYLPMKIDRGHYVEGTMGVVQVWVVTAK